MSCKRKGQRLNDGRYIGEKEKKRDRKKIKDRYRLVFYSSIQPSG
jgi:hypothetical protein